MHAAASFGYPLRAGAGRAWWAGLVLLLFFPVTFPLLLGYAVRATRIAAADPAAPPPTFGIDRRLVADGLLLSVWAAAAGIPLAALAWLLGGLIRGGMPPGVDPALAAVEAYLAGTLLAALPWGTALLLLGPPAIAAFAVSGSPRRLVDLPGALRAVRRHFAAWNLASVAIVTAWIIALAGAGLACLGFLPGAFYAILVTAHATASLAEAPPDRPQAPSPR